MDLSERRVRYAGFLQGAKTLLGSIPLMKPKIGSMFLRLTLRTGHPRLSVGLIRLTDFLKTHTLLRYGPGQCLWRLGLQVEWSNPDTQLECGC